MREPRRRPTMPAKNPVPVPVTGNTVLDSADELDRELYHVSAVLTTIQAICEVVDMSSSDVDAMHRDPIWRGLGFIAEDLATHIDRINELQNAMHKAATASQNDRPPVKEGNS